MRLETHREDVKWLRSVALPESHHIRQMAARYQNLILMAEESDKLYYHGIYTDKAKRVLKDAEGK